MRCNIFLYLFLAAALKNTCENIVPVQIKAIAVKFIIKHCSCYGKESAIQINVIHSVARVISSCCAKLSAPLYCRRAVGETC